MGIMDYRGVAETLLPDLRNDQDITWPDDAGDRKLIGYAARGMSILDKLAGAVQDYEGETLARQLLFDYVRYMRAGAANDFTANYSREILMLRQMQEVESFVGEEDADLS